MRQARAIGEFLDEFYTCGTATEHRHMLEDAPPLTGQARLDALLGAIAEYLAKQYELDPIPAWVSQPERVLRDPWFTTTLDAPGIKEFLAYSSPAEFKHRNIFTEARPLRRASMNHSRVRAGAPSPAVRSYPNR